MYKFLIGIFGAFFNSSWVKKILLGLGLSVVTTTVPLFVLNYYINQFLQNIQIGSLSDMALSLMGLARIDTAISIVIGAYIVKFNIKVANLVFRKLGA